MKSYSGFFRLFQKYLHYRFYPVKGFRCEIVERPGFHLSEPELMKLRSDLRLIAQRVVGDENANLNYGIFTEDIEAYQNVILTVIYEEKTNAPIAFNALSYIPMMINGRKQNLIHLGLVMIDKQYHKRGLSWVLYGYTSFLLFFRNICKPIWISSVTQVPSVYGQVSEAYNSVYPSLQGHKTFHHHQIAHEIMTYYRQVFGVGAQAEFDEDAFIIKNAYTGGSDALKKSFREAAKHRNERYNEHCLNTLDYERGDDYLQIGVLDFFAVKKFLLNTVPKNKLIQVLCQMGLLVISSVILPVIYWFMPSQPLGELRAYHHDKK